MFSRVFISMGKQCSKCNVIKSEEDFYTSQRGSKCKECILKVTRDYKRKSRLNPEFKKNESLKQKERRVRLWQNTLIHDSKRNKEHNLTVDDVNEMFKKQNGLCYWFNVPLIPSNNSKHPQQPSLDRLDRNKGYTIDNVILTCYSANIGRNENNVEVWEDFLKVLKLNLIK
jgi:hypothetical protein